jgi:hypothetical protein
MASPSQVDIDRAADLIAFHGTVGTDLRAYDSAVFAALLRGKHA